MEYVLKRFWSPSTEWYWFIFFVCVLFRVHIGKGLLTQRNPWLKLHRRCLLEDRRVHDSYMFIKWATCHLFPTFNIHYICDIDCYCCNQIEMRNDNFWMRNNNSKNAINLKLPASIFFWIWYDISFWTRSRCFTNPKECIRSGAIISETFYE